MTNFTNKVIKQLTFDQQKQFHNKNNRFIFQDVLVSKGVTSYRHPTAANAGLNDKIVFLGDENQINHFNVNPADIAKNIIVSRNGPQWEQVGSDIDGELAEDEIGLSISLSKDGLVMAIGSMVANTSNGDDSGKVQVHRYQQNEDGIYGWFKIGDDIIGQAAGDQSGNSVSLSADGSILAIGADLNKGPDGTDSLRGLVHVYEFKEGEGSWQQIGGNIYGEANLDLSGFSVSLSADGSIVAIGARSNNGDNGNNSGHVRVFEYRVYTEGEDAASKFHHSSTSVNGDQNKPLIITENFETAPDPNNSYWIQKGIDIDGEAAGDQSGCSVSLSADGSVVAIGAKFNKGNGDKSGHVRVYQNIDGLWNQKGGDIDGEAIVDQSGSSVSLSADGSVLAIGGSNNDDNGNNSGHVRVFEYRVYTEDEHAASKFHHSSTSVNGDQNNPLIITENFETAPVPNNSYWIQKGIDIDGEAVGDESGAWVSLSADGSIVAICAHENDGDNRERSGHVRVYEYKEGSWQQNGEDIDGEASGDLSGQSVSLSADGSIVAIGARFNDGNGDDSGHVRVYQIAKRNPWVQQGLDIDGEDQGDESGESVSLSADGSVIAIGARLNNGSGVNSGHVRVYENKNGLWKQKGGDIDGEADNDESGISVSLSEDGSVVAIGAHFNDGNGSESGHVRVYEYHGSSWQKRGQDIDGEAAGDESGVSVSLNADGSIVAIGASLNDGNGNNSGHVRVYAYNDDDSLWQKRGGDIDGEAKFDLSGYSVSLSADGRVVAIGAPLNDGNGIDSGHVRVYEFNDDDSLWQKRGGDIDGEEDEDRSGFSVSLSANGSIVAIGSIIASLDGDAGRGQVRVYEFNDTSLDWEQKGGDIDGEIVGSLTGFSVSLSDDGSIVAIGAPTANAIGAISNDSNRGHVHVHKYEGSSWEKIGVNIVGEATGDQSGWSVSLSADGSVLAIGAPVNDDNGNDSGHTRVYKFTGWGLGSV